MANRALIIVDVQNDFCEGGSLAVQGGADAAKRITEFIDKNHDNYDLIIASQDWHDPDSDNGGHIAEEPDYVSTWPAHCIAGTEGANLHKNLKIREPILFHLVRKGQGIPAYSVFEGVTLRGEPANVLLTNEGVTEVDIVGIATDYCVYMTALDARYYGFDTRVLLNLCVGIDETRVSNALGIMKNLGVEVV